MEQLKKFWPTPFLIEEKNVVSLVVQLVIFILICGVIGWLISLLAGIPVIGIIFTLLGIVMEVYGLVGIILSVLVFLGMAK